MTALRTLRSRRICVCCDRNFLHTGFCRRAPKIDGADTAWMIVATGIVLMMTIPGLALFYAGMPVRKKNILPPWRSASPRPR